MTHLISLSNGKTIDLDSAEGQYQYLANYLIDQGASSTVFSALASLYNRVFHWFDAKEMLPKEGEWVLATDGKEIIIALFREKTFHYDDLIIDIEDINSLYWMPLPQLPKDLEI